MGYIGYSSVAVIKCQNQKQLRVLKETRGVENAWRGSRCGGRGRTLADPISPTNREQREKTESGGEAINPRNTTLSDVLSPAGVHLLNFHSLPTSGDQGFKSMSL